MTECNHCSLRVITRRAVEKKKKVTLRDKNGGVDVFVHSFEKEPEKDDWVAWFAALPPRCAC
jgi:hypothetical protein